MDDVGASGDRVRLLGMVFDACHGVSAHEKVTPTRFEIDLDISAELETAGQSDNLADTVDYSAVYTVVSDVMNGPAVNLIERLAAEIARRVIDTVGCERVQVRLRKLNPHVGGVCRAAEIEIVRYA